MKQITNTTHFKIKDGMIVGYDQRGPTNITIPKRIDGQKIKGIAKKAFEGKGLRSVVLPSTITKIKKGSFLNNRLQKVKIPSSVVKVGPKAFSYNLLTDKDVIIQDINYNTQDWSNESFHRSNYEAVNYTKLIKHKAQQR